jgi:hypothetical protein
MYDHSSVLIVAILFAALIIATESGYRIGRRFGHGTSESSKSQVNSIQASILGVLALLLGFTFSLSLQRFDSRSQAVINEANAIGTAMLRTELLPESVRPESQHAVRDYLDHRVRAAGISLDHEEQRQEELRESDRILETLWQLATRAADEAPNPVTTGRYIQALNELIDAYGTRDAALNRHVPEVVLFLMFATFILTALLVGYSAGVSGHRASFATYILEILIVCLVFVIIDLDRPRRGLIEVSHQSLIELQESLRAK